MFHKGLLENFLQFWFKLFTSPHFQTSRLIQSQISQNTTALFCDFVWEKHNCLYFLQQDSSALICVHNSQKSFTGTWYELCLWQGPVPCELQVLYPIKLLWGDSMQTQQGLLGHPNPHIWEETREQRLQVTTQEMQKCHEEQAATGVTWWCLSQGNLCSLPGDSCPKAKGTTLLSWAWSTMGQRCSNLVYTTQSFQWGDFTGGLLTWHIPSPGAAPTPCPSFTTLFAFCHILPLLIKLIYLTQAFFFP